MWLKVNSFIEIPNMPLNVQVNKVQLSVHLERYTLSVSWDPPDNSENFDLEHFKVHALLEQNSRYINKTTKELGYHFNSDIIPPLGNVRITVSAVSKCSQEGLRSSAVEWREDTDRAVFTSDPNTAAVKTDKDLTALKEYESDIIMINGNDINYKYYHS